MTKTYHCLLPYIMSISIVCSAFSAVISGTVWAQSNQENDGNNAQLGNYLLLLEGFKDEELASLNAYILSNASNQGFRLESAQQSYYLFNSFLPLHQRRYALTTTLSSNQVKAAMARYFKQQDIGVAINLATSTTISLTGNTQAVAINIERSYNPYIVSLLLVCTVFIAVLLSTFLLIRKYMLQSKLEYADKTHNAAVFLGNYKKTAFLFSGLRNKWRSRAQYWEQAQHNSTVLYEQANVHAEAGETHMASSFLKKALHQNSGNELAQHLLKQLENNENETKEALVHEQKLTSNIKQAMQHCRENKPLQALEVLYQSYNSSLLHKGLSKQTEAIHKLITNMRDESAYEVNTLAIHCSLSNQDIMVYQQEKLYLGRLPNTSDIPWIQTHDAAFYINHKHISRIAQHCYIIKHLNNFQLCDTGSKNGSFINGVRCTKHVAYNISHNDMVQLGSQNKNTSVTLQAALSQQSDILHLEFIAKPSLVEQKAELQRLWPNYPKMLNTHLYMVDKTFAIILNKVKQRLMLSSPNNMLSTNESACIVAVVHLGEKASIAPYFADEASVSNMLLKPNQQKAIQGDVLETATVTFNKIPLLGEMPLILPACIAMDDIKLQLRAEAAIDDVSSYLPARKALE